MGHKLIRSVLLLLLFISRGFIRMVLSLQQSPSKHLLPNSIHGAHFKTHTSRIPKTSHHIYAEFTGKLNNTAEVESPTWPDILLSNFELDKVLMKYI